MALTYTINSGCASIDVESDLITAYVAALPSPDHTLSLAVKVDCGDPITITLDGDSLDTDNNKYVLLPADLSQTTKISDGVLHLTLTKTVTSSGDTTKQYSCLFVDCDTKCELIEFLASNSTSNAYAYYQVLTHLNTCTDCSCTDACTIWNYLQTLLGNTTQTNDCGC